MQTVSWRIRILRAAAIGFALSAVGLYVWFRAMGAGKVQDRAERASSSKAQMISRVFQEPFYTSEAAREESRLRDAEIFGKYKALRYRREESHPPGLPDWARPDTHSSEDDSRLLAILGLQPPGDPVVQALTEIQENEARAIERKLAEERALEEHRAGSTKSSLVFGPWDVAAFGRIRLTPDESSADQVNSLIEAPASEMITPSDSVLERSLQVLSRPPDGIERAAGSKSAIVLKAPDWLRIRGLWQNHDKTTDPDNTTLIEAPDAKSQP